MILIKIKMAMIPRTFVDQVEDEEAHNYIGDLLKEGFTVQPGNGNGNIQLFYPPRAIESVETEKGFTGNLDNPTYNNKDTQRIKGKGLMKHA